MGAFEILRSFEMGGLKFQDQLRLGALKFHDYLNGCFEIDYLKWVLGNFKII